MARASVQRVVRKEPKARRQVILVLTEGEADFLINQCYRVRGDWRLTPVKYAVRIREALQRAVGYDWADTDATVLSKGYIKYVGYDELVTRRVEKFKAEAQEALQSQWGSSLSSTTLSQLTPPPEPDSARKKRRVIGRFLHG